ncbi:MAG: hypothetical protein COB04_16860 [Gammaproteobacteria bacterium]|nr:MAG: hypothetical protein COB04_16860 [Gammaproteobacteria bacterium]
MKRKLIAGALTLPILLATGIGQAAENNVQDQLNDIEKRLDRIDNKAQNQLKSVSESAFKLQDRFKINGFASFGVNTSDEDDFSPYFTEINNKESYLEDSILGIQMTFKVNDKLDAVAQLTAEATNGYDVNAEWAYLSYQATDNWKIRVGRLRVPFYTASEYLDVGYAYPWARPPLEIYSAIPFTSYNGIDTFYNFNVSGFDITLQAVHGIEEFSNATGTFDTVMSGAYFNVNYNDFSFRLGRTYASINGSFQADIGGSLGLPDSISEEDFTAFLTGSPLDPTTVSAIIAAVSADPLLSGFVGQLQADPVAGAALFEIFSLTKFDVEYSDIGLTYDNGRLLVLAEATDLDYGDVDLTRIYAGNVTVGYRFNEWLPYAGVSRTYTTDEADFTKSFGPLIASSLESIGFAPLEQTTYSTGLRWDVKQGVSVKAQWDHITNLAGTQGLLTGSEIGAIPDNGINIYSLVIDAVF